SLAHAAAERIATIWRRAVRDHGHFSIALAGGDTPQRLYESLAGEPFRSRIDWSTWRVYFGDERAVPPADPQSNYHMAMQALLGRVPVIKKCVFRMEAERTSLDAAAED